MNTISISCVHYRLQFGYTAHDPQMCLFIQYVYKRRRKQKCFICESSATDTDICIGIQAFPLQLARTATAHLTVFCERAPYKYRTRDNGRTHVSDFSFIIILVIMLTNLLIYGY